MAGGSRPIRRLLIVGALLGATLAATGPADPGFADPGASDPGASDPGSASLGDGVVHGTAAPGAIGDSFVVVLHPRAVGAAVGTGPSARDLARRYGGSVRREYQRAVDGFAVTMSAAAARRLAADPAVAHVEQDRRIGLSSTQLNPPSWGLDRIDQVSPTLSRSYTTSTRAPNVTAYVLDTGARVAHRDFGGRARSGPDFIDGDGNADDCNGHGTHVAATIAGSTFGVAKGAAIVPVRVLDCDGYGTLSSVVAGIDWVTANAARPAVVNMSLGGAISSVIDRAVRASVAAGLTYAVAAGNGGGDACGTSPARVPEAITVGAVDRTDARASFSNHGSCVDLFAPGVDITSAWLGSTSASLMVSGTSMATPHVAGAVALYLADHPLATPAQVQDVLVTRAVRGAVRDAGPGSPNRLVYVGPVAPAPAPTPTPAPTPKPAQPQVPAPAPVSVPVPCNVGSNGTDLGVPDRRTVTSTIVIRNCPGRASRTATVSVWLLHPRRGDLVVELVAPNGARKVLKRARSRDRATNVIATYQVNLSRRNRNGTWRLRIRDTRRGAVGYLDRWSLTL